MTLNDLVRRRLFFTEFDSLLASYVTVVEDRTNVRKILSPRSSVPFLAKTNAPRRAISAIAELRVCDDRLTAL